MLFSETFYDANLFSNGVIKKKDKHILKKEIFLCNAFMKEKMYAIVRKKKTIHVVRCMNAIYR